MTADLDNVYKEIANREASIEGAGFKFKYWHVEGLMYQGSQLLQRLTEEWAEYFDTAGRQSALDDMVAHDQNELAAFRTKAGTAGLTPWMEHDAQNQECIVRGEIEGILTKGSAEQKLNAMYNEQARLRTAGLNTDNDANNEWIRVETLRQTERSRTIKLQEFDARVAALKKRIVSDWGQVQDRLTTASLGLCTIFGYPEHLPDVLLKVDDPKDGRTVLDTTIDWARRANAWLAAFSDNDQHFTRSFSLLDSLPKDGFKACVSGAPDGSVTFEFPIKASNFVHTQVRLRGISAYIRTKDRSDAPWRACVNVPGTPAAKFPAGTSLQPKYPSVTLGRVTYRGSPVPTEIAGSSSIGNASPISDGTTAWRISLTSPTGTKTDLDQLIDVELELHLAGIPT